MTQILATTSWEVTIPGFILPSVNRLLSAHWSRRGRIKQLAYDTILLACYETGVRPAIGVRRVGFEIRLVDMRYAPDPDNVWKILLDALVAGRILRDDKARWCKRGREAIEPGESTKTTLYIEEIA